MLFIEGLQLIAQDPLCLLWVVIGVGVGIVFGAIPGLSATMAIAIFLPITYGLSAISGISALIALYIGGISGGLISAILLNIPGTPSSVATCFDGRPMALKGQADKALGAGIIFSFLGTVFSIAAMIVIAPLLARLALKFGPHEYFAVIFFSLSLIITLSSKSLVKGLISGILGIMLSLVGMDFMTGADRFTLGITAIRGGFNVLTVLIGLFAITEVFAAAENVGREQSFQVQKDVKMRGFGVTLSECLGQVGNFFRSALIGLGIGILPGIGGGTSNILAYTVAKNRSKTPDRFGTGILDGVVASETANNASIGGAMIPLLTLGIPGDSSTAVLLGGLALHGLSPGPLVFQNHGDFLYALFLIMVLASVLMVAMEFCGLKVFIKLLKLPKYYLLPFILVLCCIGAFGLNNRIFDVGTIVFFGVIGLALVKLDIPLPPMILGFILGGMMENKFRAAVTASQGNMLDFFTRPISGVLIVVTIAFIIFSLIKVKKQSN